MALFGLIATTWVDQLSARDFGCTDDVRCAADFSVLGLVPISGGPDTTHVAIADVQTLASPPSLSITFQHQQADRPLRILTIAPKTSPPA